LRLKQQCQARVGVSKIYRYREFGVPHRWTGDRESTFCKLIKIICASDGFVYIAFFKVLDRWSPYYVRRSWE